LVAAEAARHGLFASVEHLAAEKRPRGTSIQVWAREARYGSLEVIRKRNHAEWIATAHTQNDQAETVLLNLLRGTGLRGLAGIPEVRNRILRPLLRVSRPEIEVYARRHGVPFREDPSNKSIAYRRNRIRRQLLPLLARQYNPRIVETLAALADQAREDEGALAAQADELAGEAIRERDGAVGVNISMLQTAPPAVARRLLLDMFHRVSPERHGLTRRHLAALMSLAVGAGTVRLPGSLEARATAKYLWVGPGATPGDPRRLGGLAAAPDAPPHVSIRLGKWSRWDCGRCFVRVMRVMGDDIRLNRGDPHREILNSKLLDGPLSLRAWRPGDRFRPLGLPGAKKLQDFFVDAKVRREERGRIPLLVRGEEIAWVVGHRIAEEFRWEGERVACLAEVRFSEDEDELPAGSDTPVSP
jgi:tRNA(Ile)-lysidine synthase